MVGVLGPEVPPLARRRRRPRFRPVRRKRRRGRCHPVHRRALVTDLQLPTVRRLAFPRPTFPVEHAWPNRMPRRAAAVSDFSDS